MPSNTREDECHGGRLQVRVQPKASRNRVGGRYGSALKLAVTAPAQDNQANGAVLTYLAALFQVRRSELELRAGHKSRTKTIIFTTLSQQQVEDRLADLLAAGDAG